MSISNLLSDNDYNLKINEFTLDGNQPKGTILSSDGTAMKNVAPGSDGFVLKSRTAEDTGVAWEAPGSGDGNIYENDGSIVSNRTLDTDGFVLNLSGTGEVLVNADTFNISSSQFLVDNSSGVGGTLLASNGSTITKFTPGTPGELLRVASGGGIEWASISTGAIGFDTEEIIGTVGYSTNFCPLTVTAGRYMVNVSFKLSATSGNRINFFPIIVNSSGSTVYSFGEQDFGIDTSVPYRKVITFSSAVQLSSGTYSVRLNSSGDDNTNAIIQLPRSFTALRFS